MALLAMDQFGYLLHGLIPGSVLTADLPAACRAAESGKAAVLLPSALIMQSDPLPHSWQVTSDTISAWIAHQANCPRLVLLKNVDGLLTAEGQSPSGKLIAELTVEQLAEHSGGVDGYLSQFLSICAPGDLGNQRPAPRAACRASGNRSYNRHQNPVICNKEV